MNTQQTALRLLPEEASASRERILRCLLRRGMVSYKQDGGSAARKLCVMIRREGREEQSVNRSEIRAILRSFPYDPGAYWVVAGAAMVLYGLREETADLDLGCTAALADRLEAEGLRCRRTDDGKRWFRCGESVEIFEDWLADRVVELEGVPVVSLRGLLRMKQALGREKDRIDAAMILERLRETEGKSDSLCPGDDCPFG